MTWWNLRVLLRSYRFKFIICPGGVLFQEISPRQFNKDFDLIVVWLFQPVFLRISVCDFAAAAAQCFTMASEFPLGTIILFSFWFQGKGSCSSSRGCTLLSRCYIRLLCSNLVCFLHFKFNLLFRMANMLNLLRSTLLSGQYKMRLNFVSSCIWTLISKIFHEIILNFQSVSS